MKFIVHAFDINDLSGLKKAGAFGVVCSTSFFSARGVNEIDPAQLKDFKIACEKLGLECYVQVNRFFVESELDHLMEHLKYLKEIHIDGIYFGDEAVLTIAKQLHIEDKLIYNPDTLLTNAMDTQYYLDEQLKMVTLSREITLEEICGIAKKCDPKRLEVVIHGRVNMMHSKRHLITNYLRFLNKETNVTHKHSLYIMEETRDEHMPILEDDLGTHVFSGYTLASFEELQSLQNAGITHVRIESIFHDNAYTLEALDLYQQVLHGTKTAKEIMEEYQTKYEKDHVTSGFYYQKTSKTK